MTASRWSASVLWLLAGCAFAQAPGQVAQVPSAESAPQPDRTVRDPEFGVVARHFGLERQVAMFQWRRVATGFVREWSAEPEDSRGFDARHQNPPFPMRGRRWLAKSVNVDDRPLDPAVLAALGRWRDFRPSFSALPSNLAVTFQPEGDGLGSADNPLDPQVGDLRIRWRELVLPPLQDRIELRDGRWQLHAAAPVDDAAARPAQDIDVASPVPSPRRASWWFGVGALLVLVAAIVAWRRRRRRIPQEP